MQTNRRFPCQAIYFFYRIYYNKLSHLMFVLLRQLQCLTNDRYYEQLKRNVIPASGARRESF